MGWQFQASTRIDHGMVGHIHTHKRNTEFDSRRRHIYIVLRFHFNQLQFNRVIYTMVDFWPDSLNCQILQQEISNMYNNKRILLCDEIRLS